MKVQALRVLNGLPLDAGFRVGWLDRAGQFGLVRPSAVAPTFEQLIVSNAGKHGDAVYANAAVSIVRGPMATKGLVEMSLLEELATDPERGWALIDTKQRALDWERRLADIGPIRTRELAETKGPDLLQRTERARLLVERYMESLSGLGDLGQIESWLRRQASEEQRGEAERLAQWPGVMRMRGAERLYGVAALAVAVLGRETGGEPLDEAMSDPLSNPDLMWLLQITADRVMVACGLDAEALKVGVRG